MVEEDGLRRFPCRIEIRFGFLFCRSLTARIRNGPEDGKVGFGGRVGHAVH